MLGNQSQHFRIMEVCADEEVPFPGPAAVEPFDDGSRDIADIHDPEPAPERAEHPAAINPGIELIMRSLQDGITGAHDGCRIEYDSVESILPDGLLHDFLAEIFGRHVVKIRRPVERRGFVNQPSPLPETDRADRGDVDQPANPGADAGIHNRPCSIPIDPYQPSEIPSPVRDDAGQVDDVRLSVQGFRNTFIIGDIPIKHPNFFAPPARRYAVSGQDIGGD